jgi:hypothetical protein
MDKRVSTYAKLPALSPAGREFAEIKNSSQPPLGQIPAQERPLLALNLVEHAAVSLGQKQLDEAVNRQTIQDVHEAFDLELATYTANEVRFIFTQGAKGKLTEGRHSVSTATLFRWVQAYAEKLRPQLLKEKRLAET